MGSDAAIGKHLVHVAGRLGASRLPDEDLNKDIAFSRASVDARCECGYLAARRVLEEQPWQKQGESLDGIVMHHPASRPAAERLYAMAPA